MSSKLQTFTVIILIIICINLFQCKKSGKAIHPLTKSWEKVIPHQEIPEGLTSLSAKSCGVCHLQHYNEWKLSTHAHAWTDLQFQSELKKESSPFMCINCHIPLQNQQENIVSGLIDGDIYKPVRSVNPHFDKELQLEGITCASCHVRNNAIIGPTGAPTAPHKTVKDTILLSEQWCISCHNATAVLTPTLACTFETGDEWKSGPYFGKKNCISCHMDTLSRELAPGYGIKLSHQHYFAGSGIPKFDSIESKIKNGLAIYPSTLQKTYSVNDSIYFELRLKNEFAGHKVPTGDPERFFLIKFELKNDLGVQIATTTERIGEQWEWYPAAKKLSDNNLLPNEERIFSFKYKSVQKEKLRLSVEVTKHRLNKEAASYNKLTEKYPLFITIFNKEYSTEVK
jgi:nitrate reductase cytochrome c-type subunit